MRTVTLLPVLLALCASAPVEAQSKGSAAGSPGAPIRIEVFSDFQCPACKTLYEQTLVPLRRDYAYTGKVYLIHRYFPLAMHAYGRLAASYACAAARIGRYERVAEVLFATQTAWAASGKVDEIACSVLTPAEAKRVRALVNDPSIAGEIQQDVELGQKLAVRETPTIVITRPPRPPYTLTGAVRYELLRRFLDELLAKPN